ncbi:Uncharacterised protein [Malacoplasma iowae]|uniref:Uncharacterized protein n=2 Tax=Malacoplasma iowae TaxID=2116 RepID=A0A6P1LLC9_MALIO|nr:hypothetical protein [Malacoplasma iowae]QHG89723.1 hypothetical protein EER00_02335 [Malacoplasma iowae 695]VEU62555.1 Uncharacterised protein [Mycoplasmopsis fermentans]VEU72258.1 Uncharacterised protein [Malacoplasma iowae]
MKKINRILFVKSLFITSTGFMVAPFVGSQLTLTNSQDKGTLTNLTDKNAIGINNTHTHTHREREREGGIFDSVDSTNEKYQISPIPSSEEMESDSKWIESIKETQNNNTIKLIFTRNASLVYQQSTLVTNYLLEKNNYQKNEMKNEIAFFIDSDVYKDHDKFDFSKYDELTKNYETSQFLLISNQNNFPDVTKDEDYRIFPSTEMLGTIFEFYKNKYGNDVSFDIWIPDLSLTSVWGKYNGSKEWYDILQHTNHIYITSDGNSQTFKFVESYIKWLNKQSKDIETLNNQTLTKLNSIFDKTNSEASFDAYSKSVLWDFLRTNLFTIFHITRYIDSPYYQTSTERMYPAYSFNYDYYDLSNKLFEEKSTTQKDNYISNYEKFFKVENAQLKDFVYKGFENYDPKKKNIIWMGDSLIREVAHVNSKRAEEIQNTFLGITKKYPVDQYNYFFKHHPYYTTEQQEQMTNFISKKSENIKPIYFNNFPWEMFLSWDKKEQSKNKESNQTYVPFFTATSNNETIPQTQLIGIQYTSTTILSTYLFLKQNYKQTEEQAYKSIDYNNFPVPGTFDIIYRGLPSQVPYSDQIKVNKKRTIDVYNPFLEIGYIKKFHDDQLTTKEFSNINNISSNFYNDVWYMEVWQDPITITFISIVIVITSFACLILFSYSRKQNKINSKK